MRTRLFATLLLLLALTVSCCHKIKKSSTKSTDKSINQVTLPAAIAPSLIKTHWSLTGIKGSVVQNPAEGLGEAYIVFMPDSASLTGSGGCNSMFGSYHLSGNSGIRITQTGSTKMFCENMETEMKMLNALQEVNTYAIKADTLILQKGGKIPVLSFKAMNLSTVEK